MAAAEAPQRAKRDTIAILKRANFTRWRKATVRLLALIVWLLSIGGSALFGVGGPDALLNGSPFWIGGGAVLLFQLLLSWIQLVHSDDPRSLWYIGSVVLSSSLTCLGYEPLFSRWVAGYELTTMLVLSVLGILFALAADVWPERKLIGD